ncbi:uncharacterized protein LOC114560427 isoform X1 [Perca flavescens]|uniref:uncharacterized protein LOC114560427 isoform X1 n=1 Tax=Perca flavescens TaxID=8167 RepID=UPI00106E3D19|nr:uncharacterized protein LOC114560427 isoform X1 [Perca flavescens]
MDLRLHEDKRRTVNESHCTELGCSSTRVPLGVITGEDGCIITPCRLCGHTLKTRWVRLHHTQDLFCQRTPFSVACGHKLQINQVMCLSATTNNLASTACSAFKKATERHGIPSRVRGDQGIENVTLPDLWSAFGELTGEASCQGKVFTIKGLNVCGGMSGPVSPQSITTCFGVWSGISYLTFPPQKTFSASTWYSSQKWRWTLNIMWKVGTTIQSGQNITELHT